jgi:hypothetical protein
VESLLTENILVLSIFKALTLEVCPFKFKSCLDFYTSHNLTKLSYAQEATLVPNESNLTIRIQP